MSGNCSECDLKTEVARLRGLLREASDSWDQVEHAGTMRYADGCFARLTNDWRERVTAALEAKP